MDLAQPGDLFREAGGPARLWRVAAVRPGAFELVCVQAPNLSRFATREKLFDRNHYRPEAPATNNKEH